MDGEGPHAASLRHNAARDRDRMLRIAYETVAAIVDRSMQPPINCQLATLLTSINEAFQSVANFPCAGKSLNQSLPRHVLQFAFRAQAHGCVP
jgi:hypothetical protein